MLLQPPFVLTALSSVQAVAILVIYVFDVFVADAVPLPSL